LIIQTQYFKLVNSTQLGYILIITSAILYALAHVIAKPLLGDSSIVDEDTIQNVGINPITLAACIYLINGLFFTPIARKTTGPSIFNLGRKNLLLLIGIGIAEVSALITYLFGLKDSTAVNASIFSNTEVIFSLLIVMIVFRERLQKNEMLPFVMIIVGMIILPVGYDLYENGMSISGVLLGDALIILSGLFYAIDVNICKYVSDKIDAKRVTQITSFASGIFALLVLVILKIPFDVNLNDIPMISLLGIAGTGIATLFFVMALRLLGGVKAILLYSTTAIFGIIFSGLILYEEITFVDIFSITLVILGIYLMRNKLAKE
jgi:drug/metabolite transporter (DMT)-like permease